MNIRHLPIHVEHEADKALSQLDEAQHQQDQRSTLIAARGDEILKQRCASLSDEDLALAFETLSTYPLCINAIKHSMQARHSHFAETLETFVHAALVPDSCRQAYEEFAMLDDIKTENCH
jgi:hypothetical protein